MKRSVGCNIEQFPPVDLPPMLRMPYKKNGPQEQCKCEACKQKKQLNNFSNDQTGGILESKFADTLTNFITIIIIIILATFAIWITLIRFLIILTVKIKNSNNRNLQLSVIGILIFLTLSITINTITDKQNRRQETKSVASMWRSRFSIRGRPNSLLSKIKYTCQRKYTEWKLALKKRSASFSKSLKKMRGGKSKHRYDSYLVRFRSRSKHRSWVLRIPYKKKRSNSYFVFLRRGDPPSLLSKIRKSFLTLLGRRKSKRYIKCKCPKKNWFSRRKCTKLQCFWNNHILWIKK